MISGERSMRKSATFDQSKLEDSTTNAAIQIPGNTNGTPHQKLASPFPQWQKTPLNYTLLVTSIQFQERRR